MGVLFVLHDAVGKGEAISSDYVLDDERRLIADEMNDGG